MSSRNRIRLWHDTRGATMVEFAIVLPVLLMITLGILDLGRLGFTVMTLNRAVSAAARCGAIASSLCPNVQTYAVQQAWGMSLPPETFTVTPAGACTMGTTNGFEVSANYDFDFVLPWWPGDDPLPLVARACYLTQ